jgi:hypothetical protein
MANAHRCRITNFVFCVVFVFGLGHLVTSCSPSEGQKPILQKEQELIQMRVDPGDKKPALDYYTASLEELGLKNWGSLPTDTDGALTQLGELQNLNGALDFMGYKDLIPADFEKNLENLSSEDLMKKYPGELLAAAFFAPKITDVSGIDPTKINVGWRKVIFLKARNGSPAEAKGIGSGYLLFNKFQGAGNWNEDPIKPRANKSNESQTTQFILTRAIGKPLKFPCYFLVYGKLSGGGKLRPTLDASFDARAPNLPPVQPYYVPNACAQCHGGEVRPKVYDLTKIKINFLDTDHWIDRVQTGDDFAFIKNTPFGVLYDGGKDESSAQFKAAFDVLRQINVKIKEQNDSVDGAGAPSFQLRAARKWVELHTTDTSHKDVFQRALPPINAGDQSWQSSASPDKDLLPLMNRYCYRCHSSVRFDLFDRPAVASRKAGILIRLNSTNSAIFMPQDRELPPNVKKKLIDLVNTLP